MLPLQLVYSHRYDMQYGSHVFASHKYRLIHDRMLKEGFARPEDFVEPPCATDDDVMLVHDRFWVDKLQEGTLTLHELMKLEAPYSHQMVDAFWMMAGGSILASRNALRDGIGFNIGGGFHHAFQGHGEGFCAIHDVAIAIRKLRKEGLIRKALIVDTDCHQGNGTAGIFAGDPDTYTLSIHQFNNYPTEKPPSTVDINLEDGVTDADYLDQLRGPYRMALEVFRPDMVFHVSGADPFMEDQLGGLLLTLDGLVRRDRLVYEMARDRNVPVMVSLAGGYAFNVHDTVTIHVNTAKVAVETLQGIRTGVELGGL